MDEVFPGGPYFAFGITGRLFAGLLFFLVLAGGAWGQTGDFKSIERAVNRGQFEQVVANAPDVIVRSRKAAAFSNASEIGILHAQSLIRLERYGDAQKALDQALPDAEKSKNSRLIAAVYFLRAGLLRLQKNFRDAIGHARKGLASAPNDLQVKLDYYLAIGRILYSSGYDISAIVWLEKAEKLSSALPISPAHLDVLGHLSFAWVSKFNYAKALEYGEKLVNTSERTEYKYRHRLALYELGNLLSSVGQERRATALLEKGFNLASKAKDDYQSCLFLSTLVLSSLYKGDVNAAEKRLLLLEALDRNRRFPFATTLGKAVVAGLKGKDDLSETHFKELASLKNYSEIIIPRWRLTLAERKKDWTGLLEATEALRTAAEKRNFRDELPAVYLNFAKGYLGLGKDDIAIEYAKRAAAIVENDRPKDAPVSLAILETYHSVYRLWAQAEESRDDATASIKLADYSKARVLRDRIESSGLRLRPDLESSLRRQADELAARFIEGNEVQDELASLERSVTLSSPRGDAGPSVARRSMGNIDCPANTAIVSYFFTLSGELRAYIVEHGKPVRIVKLSLSEKEADTLAETVRTKIRDKVFFKSDGKGIYNKLLLPLSIGAEHIVIVPDKSLWKIPFQALSSDGVSYLIEKSTVSYALSVSMLLNELAEPKPARSSIQVFANDSFRDRYLAYVNPEATRIARIFGSHPVIGATRLQFLNLAGGSDILHFSMHAQAERDEPLDSFLGFRGYGQDSGRVTVEDLQSVRLKKQSLAFLASCETTNVLNGEGMVSIAWALLGSGSTSVIAAQWDVNDKSTAIFTETFHTEYRKGSSVAHAMQVASITMIRNKTSGAHEPYHWAPFFLIGDYR